MDTVEEIVRSVLNVEADYPLHGLNPGNCESWDSLATMQLVVGLEESLSIRLTADQISQLLSYEDILRIFTGKYNSKMSKSTVEELTPFESLKFWNHYRENNKHGDFSAGVFGSFTTDSIAAHLGTSLAKKSKEKSVSITNGAFRQHLQIVNNFREEFVSDVDFLVLLWRLEDVVEGSLLSYLYGDDDALITIIDYVNILAKNIERWNENDPPILVSVNEIWLPESVNKSSLKVLSRFAFLQNKIYEKLHSAGFGKSNINLLNWVELTLTAASDTFLDKRNQMLYSDPFSSRGGQIVGQNLAKIIYASKFASNKKVLVLDCDNTLWGGVVGEVGFDGVEIGSDGDGYYFLLFQKEIKQLKDNGTLLALSSKNNIGDVQEVFLRNESMVLKWDDFVSHEVNWEPKPQAIEKISADLNILPDDFVFVDDSDFEIEAVRSAIQGITTMKVPHERFEIPGILAQSEHFSSENTSTEDRNRTGLIKAEKARKTEKDKLLSNGDFLSSLNLGIEISPIDSKTLGRATQLINKTNQFNLTTKRRSESELKRFLAEPKVHGFIASATDKFGYYGYIGLCILVQESTTMILDTFLMSCRALGREIEFAFLNQVLQSHKNNKLNTEAHFFPTKKNMPAASFLREFGFIADLENKNKFILSDLPVQRRGTHIERIRKSNE
jgi:FkbH-like protein